MAVDISLGPGPGAAPLGSAIVIYLLEVRKEGIDGSKSQGEMDAF